MMHCFFVEWFTDERRLALFPSGTIFKYKVSRYRLDTEKDVAKLATVVKSDS